MRLSINYDIVPANGRSDLAVAFDVSTWTNLAYLSGRVGFTSHAQPLNDSGENVPIVAARARFVWEGAGSYCRLVSLRYDDAGNRVWRNFNAIRKRDAYNVDNQAVDVLASLQSDWNAREGLVQYFCEVSGTGKVYEARLELEYDVPNLAPVVLDQQAQINALAARLSALEGV